MNDDKTFALTVTEQELNVISAGLDELPRKFSQPLMTKLQEQINKQVAALNAPVVEPVAE